MTTENEKDQGSLFRWLWSNYLKQHIGWLLVAILLMAIEGSTLGAMSWLMGPMFDSVFIEGDRGVLWLIGLGFMAIFMLRGLASMGQKVVMARVSMLSSAHMRTDLLDHLMEQDGSFHTTHPPGFLIQRVQGDVGAIATVWNTIITGAGRDIIATIVLLGVAIQTDWKWTLVACFGVPLLVLPSQLVQGYVRNRSREAADLSAKLATRLDEVFHGLVPIKLNRIEKYQSNKYRGLTDDLVSASVRASFGGALIPALIDIMAGLGFLGVLLYGGNEIMNGDKTIGEFMTFFTAIGFVFEPLRRLGAISAAWQGAAAAIERVKELLDVQATITSPDTPQPLSKAAQDIVIKDVHLAYDDTQVLFGLNLTAEAGKTTALVGPSGAGKSTIFNVLTRLVDPQKGSVKIGGIETKSLALETLRNQFSVVSQDAALFDETLRENILLEHDAIPSERMDKVLKAAHVEDFLPKLPDGLDSPVGPRGSNLSGGQRQRVAIARALLRDTPVLLLDEATSALDTQSEKVVQEALDKLSENRTTLVIAHRLSTVRNADKIVVMDRGRVVDEGTHDELLARGGVYARLYDLQFRNDGPSADKRVQELADQHHKDISAAAKGSSRRGVSSLLSRISLGLWQR